jgi:hypothetical protein
MKKICLITYGLLFTAVHFSMAQSRQQALHKWYWFPATEKTVFYRTGEWYGFAKPQQQKMYANMARILELIHQTPCINPPKGFEAGISATICENGCTRGKIMSGYSGIVFRAFYTQNNSTTIERDAEGPSFRVYFNDITRLLSRLPAGSEPYYEERDIIDSIQGFPVYAGENHVVITKRKARLFTPISREQLLQIEINEKEKNLKKMKEAFKQSNAEWNVLISKMPAKDSLQKKELLKNIADQKPYIEKFEKELAAHKTTLAALAATERKQPALNYYQEKRLVVPNPNFFNPALPAHAIQLVVIDFNNHTLGYPAGHVYGDLFRQIKKTLDLKKILAVLEE